MPAVGQRIADRYEILAEIPRAGGAALYRARDLAFGEIVALKHLAREAAAQRLLEAEVRRIQRHSHAGFVRLYGVEPSEGLLVREWVHGFSLLELIRRHRELPAAFALRLLDHLPALLDAVTERSLKVPGSLLTKVLVRFAESVSPEQVIAQPIADWPAFSLQLNVLSVRRAAPDLDSEHTTTATLTDLRDATGAGQPAPARLAALLYEILGGPNRAGQDRRYTPLPALREEGNGVLRRALLESPYTECHSLWADLLLAEPTKARPPAPLPPSTPALELPWIRSATVAAEPAPATLLKLAPADRALAAIHLVARPQFKIGRSLFHADYITRFLPEGPASDDLTNQLSRVHVLAEAAGRHVLIRDGNGDSPSVNGTTIDDEPLDAEQPAMLRHRALLTLGGVYSLEAIPLVGGAPAALQITDTEPAPADPRDLSGAVFFLPANRLPAVRHAVWIFSEAGFGLDGAGSVIWDTRGCGQSPATFFHERGSFWLGNRALGSGELTIAGLPLAPGEIAPLRHAQELRIATHAYTIELA